MLLHTLLTFAFALLLAGLTAYSAPLHTRQDSQASTVHSELDQALSVSLAAAKAQVPSSPPGISDVIASVASLQSIFTQLEQDGKDVSSPSDFDDQLEDIASATAAFCVGLAHNLPLYQANATNISRAVGDLELSFNAYTVFGDGQPGSEWQTAALDICKAAYDAPCEPYYGASGSYRKRYASPYYGCPVYAYYDYTHDPGTQDGSTYDAKEAGASIRPAHAIADFANGGLQRRDDASLADALANMTAAFDALTQTAQDPNYKTFDVTVRLGAARKAALAAYNLSIASTAPWTDLDALLTQLTSSVQPAVQRASSALVSISAQIVDYQPGTGGYAYGATWGYFADEVHTILDRINTDFVRLSGGMLSRAFNGDDDSASALLEAWRDVRETFHACQNAYPYYNPTPYSYRRRDAKGQER